MKRSILGICITLLLASCINVPDHLRVTDFNRGWKFSLSSAPGAQEFDFNDSGWREVDLPHDWSVEFPFDSINGEGCTAYLPGGTGWYRKYFRMDADPDQKVFAWFDGVYNNSEYWINGHPLGEHPYGYSPFWFDLTPYLSESGDNVLAVKVDRRRLADSRWYPGSGIYRNVKLVRTRKLYIPIWGTFVTTPEVSNLINS